MYHITEISSNAKVGPIPVSTSDQRTCPSTCPLKKSCYAKAGPLALHWAKVSDGSRAISLKDLCTVIRKLPKDQLWRHNQAGDLPGEDTTIDKEQLLELVNANKGRKGFTYTHKPVENHDDAEVNKELIKTCNENGFTVNLSANTIEQADRYVNLGIGPVVVVLPENAPKNQISPEGNKVIVCPAQLNKTTSCNTCRLCQKADRNFVIGFRAHGSRKKYLEEEVN